MRPIALLSFAVLALPLAAGASQDPVADLVAQRSQQAEQLKGSPRATVPLLRLHSLRDDVEDLRPIERAENDLAHGGRVNPYTRAFAQQLLLELDRSQGRTARVNELYGQLGYLHDFFVLGGFDNDGKGGCDTDFGPEGSIDLAASYPAKGHATHWQKSTLRSTDGYVDLATLVRPNHQAVAYALTYLSVPRDRTVTLALGASGAYRLWVDGQIAVRVDRYNHPRPDQSRVSVRLRRGLNPVLLKVCQDDGPFGFYLRTEGGASATELPDKAPATPRGVKTKLLPTLESVYASMVKAKPKDPELRAEYAMILNQTRAFDDKDHDDAAQADRAATQAKQAQLPAARRADVELIAAKLQTEDQNLQRQHLEAALTLMPNSVEAQLAMAQHELNDGHPDRAQARLTHVLQQTPNFSAARLLLAHAEEDLGDWPRAIQEIEAVYRDHHQLPIAAREAARISRKLDRIPEALSRLRVAVSLRSDDLNSRRALAALLSDLGQIDESVAEYQRLLKLEPFDNGVRLKLAELLCANGRTDEGLAKFAEAKQLSPADEELYQREGRALLQAGQQKAAIASFNASLALRPQNPGLREVLRSLEGSEGTSGLQYAVDISKLGHVADGYEFEDAVILADYTYVKVQPSGLSSTFKQLAVKVFSERGADAYRSYPITYSPNRQEVRILKARVIKPDGSVVESFGDNESNLSEPWTGMYYDARVRVLSFPTLAKGDTLEIQYRLEDTAQDNLLSDYWGDVDFVQSTYPKLRYQFYVEMPAHRPLYWNSASLGKGVAAGQQELPDGARLYTWSASYVPKVTPEPSMPGWSEVATTLHVSTYKDWEQVGRYYWSLVRDQLTPTDEMRATVDRILKGVDRKDQLAVVRAIYDFVVTNTRYVALEFGIHGYKPYRVDRILARRFGDCKDKASLIDALLKIAGVDSRLVLLRMRHLGALAEEPASLAAFNHAIVYVPRFNLYLDGTAEFSGASELPSADRLADVLIVDPDGRSRFVTIPEAQPTQNRTDLAMQLTLRRDGTAAAHGTSTVSGEGAPAYRRAYQSVDSRRATFEEGWAQLYPGLTVKQVKLNDTTQLEKPVALDYDMQIPRFAEVLPNWGLRFFVFGTGRSYTQEYAPLVSRHYDVLLSSPWVHHFRYHYRLPPGYTVAQLPPDASENSPFGKLAAHCRVGAGEITCEGDLSLTQTRIKAEEYKSFRTFLERVDQDFSRKIVLAPPASRAQGSASAAPALVTR